MNSITSIHIDVVLTAHQVFYLERYGMCILRDISSTALSGLGRIAWISDGYEKKYLVKIALVQPASEGKDDFVIVPALYGETVGE